MYVAFTGLAKDRVASFLSRDDVFATALLVLCVDAYGAECFDWELETLFQELETDFGVTLSGIARDKLAAILTIMTTDAFYTDPNVFWQICNVLSGSAANFETGSDPVDGAELAWAVVEALINDMQDGNLPQPSFSAEIAAMAGAILTSEGFTQPPQMLSFARVKPLEPMDPQTLQAAMTRNSQLTADLAEQIRIRLTRLNEQLQQLPLSVTFQGLSGGSQRNYLDELLSSEAPRETASA